MGRFRRYQIEEYQRMKESNPDSRYSMAYKRMKRIKGFYVHLCIYILVNTALIVAKHHSDVFNNPNIWRWQTFNTALFWGIGLAAHGLSVFGREAIFSSNWEEKKIKEIMNKDKENKWE